MRRDRDNSISRLSELGAVALLLAALAWAGFLTPLLARVGIPLAVVGIVFAAAGLIETRVEQRPSASLALLGMVASIAAVIAIAVYRPSSRTAEELFVAPTPLAQSTVTTTAQQRPVVRTYSPPVIETSSPVVEEVHSGDTYSGPDYGESAYTGPAYVDSRTNRPIAGTGDEPVGIVRRFGDSAQPLSEGERRAREQRSMAILRERLGGRVRESRIGSR